MPIVDGKYVAPTWSNNTPPAINAEELQAMSNMIVQNQDKYTKVQSLSSTTAALYGLGNTAVPDQVLAKIAGQISAVDGKIKIVNGTFVGSITNEKTLVAGFAPKLFFLVQKQAYGSNGEVRFYLCVTPYMFWASQTQSSGRTNTYIYSMDAASNGWITTTGVSIPKNYLMDTNYSYLIIG